jgi:hypothetical protein
MWRAGLEAQQVISLRVAMLAGGGVAASAETNRMMAEKMSFAMAFASLRDHSGMAQIS